MRFLRGTFLLIATHVTSVLLTCETGAKEEEHREWYYGIEGEEHWSGKCRGKFQSPININTNKAIKLKFNPDDSLLNFHNYDEVLDANIHNNGHTVQIKIPKSSKVTIDGAILQMPYRLVQIHFHWGSEHTINSKRYPLEVHFVHVREALASLEEGQCQHNGILVIGALFNYDAAANTDILNFTNILKNVSKVDSSRDLTIEPSSLLPCRCNNSYYYYEGSLTTPPCTEGVIWILFENFIPISKMQVNAFKKLETKNGTNVSNYRNTMPLGSGLNVLLIQPNNNNMNGIASAFCDLRTILLIVANAIITSFVSSYSI